MTNDFNGVMVHKEDIKYGFHILNTIETLKDLLKVQKVQSKLIVEKLKSVISSQTVYVTLQALVENDYLVKYQEGKFSFYNTTNKGVELLNNIREYRNKCITEPLVESMVNSLREKYPKEFEDISDRDLSNYLYNKIKKFEELIIKDAVINFKK